MKRSPTFNPDKTHTRYLPIKTSTRSHKHVSKKFKGRGVPNPEVVTPEVVPLQAETCQLCSCNVAGCLVIFIHFHVVLIQNGLSDISADLLPEAAADTKNTGALIVAVSRLYGSKNNNTSKSFSSPSERLKMLRLFYTCVFQNHAFYTKRSFFLPGPFKRVDGTD